MRGGGKLKEQYKNSSRALETLAHERERSSWFTHHIDMNDLQDLVPVAGNMREWHLGVDEGAQYVKEVEQRKDLKPSDP